MRGANARSAAKCLAAARSQEGEAAAMDSVPANAHAGTAAGIFQI